MTIQECRERCERLYPSAENVSQRAKDAVWNMAWDLGHSGGFEEIVGSIVT